MEIIEGRSEYYIPDSCGVGLGNFDGFHLGHARLTEVLNSRCHELGIKSMIYTFANHPNDIISHHPTAIILSKKRKINLFEGSGVDMLWLENFDGEYCHMSPDDFVTNIIIKKLKAKLVVVGFNYRFGYMGVGDTKLLEEYGKKYGFEVIVIPPVMIEDEIVSSTSIREYISSGDIEKANEFLGRPFAITDKIISGNKIGAKLLVPTANFQIESVKENLLLPPFGVYITSIVIDGIKYKSITNFGKRPTIDDGDKVTVETYILDFSRDVYGAEVTLEFYKRLRDEKKFDSIDALRSQIDKDISDVREYFKG